MCMLYKLVPLQVEINYCASPVNIENIIVREFFIWLSEFVSQTDGFKHEIRAH